MKGIVMKSMSRSVAAGVFIMLLFGFIQNLSACPLVKDIKAEPEVICAKNGETTISFTADWSEKGSWPWDKNHTIQWGYEKDGGNLVKKDPFPLKKVKAGSNTTASGSFEIKVSALGGPGNYVISVWALGEKEGKTEWGQPGKCNLTVVDVRIQSVSKTLIEYCESTQLKAISIPSGRPLVWDIKDVDKDVVISPPEGSKVSIGNSLTVKANRFTKSGAFTAQVYDKEVQECKDEYEIEVKGFNRTDCSVEDTTELEYTSSLFYWVAKHGTSTKTEYKLTYKADSQDTCDGKWKHDYFLVSSGTEGFTIEKDKKWWIGGALYAVGWVVDANGTNEYQNTLGADCRDNGGGNVSLTVGGVKLTVPVTFNAKKVTVGTDFNKNIKISVNMDSPEGSDLQKKVKVIISYNGKFVDEGNYKIKFHYGKRDKIVWNDSKVLENHFEPLPCK